MIIDTLLCKPIYFWYVYSNR